MKTRLGAVLVIASLLFIAPCLRGQGQAWERAQIIVPASSVEHIGDRGVRAHTNHLIRAPQRPQKGKPSPPPSGPRGETPDSIRAVYSLPSSGGGGIIAIVDAYDYPTAVDDFNTFSTQFGLPTGDTCNGHNPCISVVYASGSRPGGNCAWNQEAALDIEWAHAMAPDAQIVLVEADSSSFTDLFQGVDVASTMVSAHSGSGAVSMSWGGGEFSSETTYDSHFTTANVVFTAASGDSGGKNIYPSTSPNVVSAGGTTINRDANGNFVSETAWSGSGGGPSKYESRPTYQNAIIAIVGNSRGAPDFSFDADPYSGVSVYDSTTCQGLSGWMVFGGTSVSAPSLAGIINLASSEKGHSPAASSFDELVTIYNNLGTAADFRDITSGRAGKFKATTGWDFITGVGSDQATDGK
jgi:subtilase family serine protease